MTEDLIDAYCVAMSEPNPANRRAGLERSFAESVVFTSPPTGVLEGREALIAYMDQAHEQMPGFQLIRISDVKKQDWDLRFQCKVVGVDGQVMVSLIDHLCELDEQHRISRMSLSMGPPR